MLKHLWFTVLTRVACLPLALSLACSDSETHPSKEAGTTSGDVRPVTGKGGVKCCPLQAPSCDAPYIGGTLPASGRVEDCERGPWDVAPIEEDWNVEEDENGCPVYVSFSEESCISAPLPEGGVEPVAAEAAIEAGPAEAGAADSAAEAGSDSGVICCPIEPPSCDAPLRGGHVPASGSLNDCQHVDFDVAPIEEEWIVAIDEFGCEFYESVSQESCHTRPPSDSGL